MRKTIKKIILQIPSTYETRSVRLACMLQDGYEVINSTVEDLFIHENQLLNGGAMPVGTVEFVRAGMSLAGFEEPIFNCYPEELNRWFKRKIEQCSIDNLEIGYFIKPVKTKLFNGFLFEGRKDDEIFVNAEMDKLTDLPNGTRIWKCEPVKFVSEWRYYIDHGRVLGCARYDEGPDNSPKPNADEVMLATAVASNVFNHGFAMDMGVLSTGETCLVELNDAWAIGLYDQSITPLAYTSWLLERWNSMKRSF